jgi:cupin fold WbuC family metalloprotein
MKFVAATQLDDLARQARASARGRAHLNVHAGADDPVQRFFVSVDRRSYIRPHRHNARSEMALATRGSFDVLVFNDEGEVRLRQTFGVGAAQVAYEADVAVWHMLVALEDASTFLEIKQGPYDPTTAAEFAHWSPAEADATASRFLEWARSAQVGDSYRNESTNRRE